MDLQKENNKQSFTLTEAASITETESPPCIGIRHLQIVLLFFCLVTAYIIRVNISLAIVSMTGNATIPGIPVYDWDITTKSTLLSSFFWGYLVMNLPAAIIGHSVNNKFLLGSSFATAGVLAMLIPSAAAWGGSYAVIIIRICQGLAQGFMMPMVHGLLSQWAPPGERARQSSYILGGINFGTMVVSLLSGFLATTPWGWPSIFYISGGLGILWAVVWFALGANSPATHPLISQVERQYIEKALPHTSRDGKKMKIPWKHILTSPPVYSTTLAHWGHNWGLWTILTQVPTYFNSALGFDIKDLGFLYAMPFLCVWLIAFPLSYLADYLIRKGVTSVTASRKIWNSIGHWGGAAGLIGIALAGSNQTVAMTLYSIVITISCCVYMGFNVNHLDLSPNFARILMGITNGTSNVTSILGPLFVGFIVNDETNVEEWRIVFYISAASFFIGNLVFVIFGSGELQPWNDPEEKVFTQNSKLSGTKS